MSVISPYYKAVVACIVAALTAAGTALADGHITAQEYIVIAIAFLTSGGLTYAVPNKPKPVEVDRRTIDEQTRDATGITDV